MESSTATISTIREIGKHEGQSVTIRGWLYNLRASGKLLFPQFRDGSGVIQGVVAKNAVSPELFEAIKGLTQESSVIVTGTVRADQRAPGGYELDVTDAQVVQRVSPDDPYPGPIVRSGAKTDGTANSMAAYLFDTATIGDHLELTGGLRWDRFAVDYTSTAVTGEATSFDRTDIMTSGRAGVIYKPRQEGSIYAGFGTSFNPSAEGLSLAAANVDLEPEKSRNFELGTKWDLFRQQLSATAALFRTEKTNARTPGVNPGDPPTVLAGEQRVSGIEFGLSGRVRSWWTAIVNYAHLRSTIAESNTPAEIDQNLALTPEHTLALWSTFELPGGVGLGGGAQYMDSVFRNATNTARVPSYWLINATASYAVNSHLTLRFNSTNLANEQYVDRIGGGHYIPGPGRQMLVTATIKK